MAILVTCPNCSTKLKAPDTAAGRKVKCPKCGGVIPVPGAEEEPIDLAQLGVTAEPPAPPSRPRRERADEFEQDQRGGRARRRDGAFEEDERDARARRRRELDDEYDDDGQRERVGAASGGGLSLGLGIASLSVGILGLLISWIPCIGALSWPICAIGLILGVIGLIIAISKGGPLGFPIAGSAVSGVALAISLLWVLLWARAVSDVQEIARNAPNLAREMQKAALEAQKQQAEIAKQLQQNAGKPIPIPLNGPPTPANGEIKLAAGKGQVDSELTQADPSDRVQQFSKCKVFTVNMKAGRTYQIDMIRKEEKKKRFVGGLDPYLRLEDFEGKQLMADDDGGGNLNARLTFQCDRDGTYRLVATALAPVTGRFTLKVEEK